MARTIDGVTGMVELLHQDREPRFRSGPSCRWCPMLDHCEIGTAYVAGDDPTVELADDLA